MCKETPITMKWKEDTNKDNQGPGDAKNGDGEGKDPTENQNDSFNVLLTVHLSTM